MKIIYFIYNHLTKVWKKLWNQIKKKQKRLSNKLNMGKKEKIEDQDIINPYGKSRYIWKQCKKEMIY